MAASKGSRRRSPGGAGKAPPAKKAEPAKRKDAEILRLERLLDLMSEHALAELEVRGDGSVRLSKCGPVASYSIGMGGLSGAAYAGASLAAAPLASSASAATPASPSAATPASAPGAVPAATKSSPAGDPFLSPMVGTFYRASSPEAKPFVMEGDSVKPESVICIIEAMKVLNEIKAEKNGKIVQILVENGEAVEYGQPLFIIQRT